MRHNFPKHFDFESEGKLISVEETFKDIKFTFFCEECLSILTDEDTKDV